MSLLQNTINRLQQAASRLELSPQRKQPLGELATVLEQGLKGNFPIHLNFICTHNSRRSHLAAIMAQLAGDVYEIDKLQTFSGGTQATAFHKNAVEALRSLGISIELHSEQPEPENPRYVVNTGKTTTIAFSKIYSAPPNPESNYTAILVCSSADANCPVVFGASKRIALPYEDPQKADGRAEQLSVYQNCALLIGTEIFWAFQQALKSATK